MDLENSRKYIREYMKKYRQTKKGKEMVKKANATYYQNNKELIKKYNSEYYRKNKIKEVEDDKV